MAQRSQMFYAYFRFYIDEAEIIAGMEQYCTEWEHMFAIGYNYTEYKCFVDNIGGFEHWVGDMRGYISPTRETGFLDAAPSDSVYDSTLLMGNSRFDGCDLRYLHYQKPSNAKVIVRKVSAISPAEAILNYSFGASGGINHSFYGAYDDSKIEIVNYSEEIVDGSVDVTSMNATFDVASEHTAVPTVDPATTFTNPERTIDGNFATYVEGTGVMWKYLYLDLGSIQDIYNICYKYRLYVSGGLSYIYLYYGDTVAGATNAIENDSTAGTKTVDKVEFRDLGITGRFLKFGVVSNHASGIERIYQIYVS